MVRVGGIIATDNILYPEEYRSMMTNYTNYIKNKPNIQSMMIPIGNGEELTIKLA
jgi:predicted O-methyltransferase YrrM